MRKVQSHHTLCKGEIVVRKDFSIAASRLSHPNSPSDPRTIHQPLAPSYILLTLRIFWYDEREKWCPIRIIAGTKKLKHAQPTRSEREIGGVFWM